MTGKGGYSGLVMGGISVSANKKTRSSSRQRTPDEVVCIVLKVLCGYESVGEICQREGITLDQYHQWQADFVQACRSWAKNDARAKDVETELRALRAGDEEFAQAAAGASEDLVDWADDRLAAAWIADQEVQAV